MSTSPGTREEIELTTDSGCCTVRVVDPELVIATRSAAANGSAASRAANIFRLLGDPGRIRILSALTEAGELCVCDLAAVVDASESNVSHSLRLLRTSGVVSTRRVGKRIYYRLDDPQVRQLVESSLTFTTTPTEQVAL